ncbi:alpha/beta-hydrolase, partial [Aureobasidium melanogenum]
MPALVKRILYTAVGSVSLIIRSLCGLLQNNDHQKNCYKEAEKGTNQKSEYLRLSNGIRIHYHCLDAIESASDLVIFIHGFPDSCHLWTGLINNHARDEANLVALDLPGFGKSEGLSSYGSDDMLTTIYLAIVEFKKSYSCQHCIVVGHDWGGIIASRIAAQTQGLIDHLVLVNSLFVPHFSHMIEERLEMAGQIFSAGVSNQSYTSWLNEIWQAASPVVSQLYKSNYIFMFQLSFFSATKFDWALKSILSACYKWSQAEIQDVRSGHTIGSSLAGHQHDYSLNAWNDRVRLYREGLMSEPWRFAPQHQNGVQPDDKTVKCTTTVIFGLQDQALNSRIAVDGIDAFIQPPTGHPKGCVYLLEDVGHWSPLNARCIQVIQHVLAGAKSHAEVSSSSRIEIETVQGLISRDLL